MTDQTLEPITIPTTRAERERLERDAHLAGYEDVGEYARVRLLETEDFSDVIDPTDEQIIASLREALEDVKAGRTYSEAEFWAEVSDEQ